MIDLAGLPFKMRFRVVPALLAKVILPLLRGLPALCARPTAYAQLSELNGLANSAALQAVSSRCCSSPWGSAHEPSVSCLTCAISFINL